ncbi:UDP-N-acetylmuramate--alanine ligase [bacterium]|nr:UDP-N-acetylmuramate--alanine ligase [candidate division CSSED10-310 bacterium]
MNRQSLRKASDSRSNEKIFLVGIGGSGMSGLAKLLIAKGYHIRGSDREFDRNLRQDFYTKMIARGIAMFPQDGSGITDELDRIVASTAVESNVPDIVAAKKQKIPIIHRSSELARQMSDNKSIAIAGTSGKTTITAMTAWILTQSGFDPTVISGAEIPNFGNQGEASDVRVGNSEWFIFEADESDGSLTNYHPEMAVVHNITKDHKPIEDLRNIFSRFADQVHKHLLIHISCPESMALKPQHASTISYGFDRRADISGEKWESMNWMSRFHVSGHTVFLKMPGFHNATNALAAYAAATIAGVPEKDAATALKTFPGVSRRFEKIGTASNVDIIDDFAHNPDKIKASLNASHALSTRILVIYQPHGFGPTQFLFDDLITTFTECLSEKDHLILLPIFYAGGTASRTVSSEQLAEAIRQRGKNAQVMERNKIPDYLAEIVTAGDLVMIMGARDPSLSDLARMILKTIESKESNNFI